MQNIIISLIATISFVTLAIYDFLCICLVTKKEKLAEKLWKRLLVNKPYDSNRLFWFLRPVFLQISLFSYLLSGGILNKLLLFDLLLILSPPLTVGVAMKNLHRE